MKIIFDIENEEHLEIIKEELFANEEIRSDVLSAIPKLDTQEQLAYFKSIISAFILGVNYARSEEDSEG